MLPLRLLIRWSSSSKLFGALDVARFRMPFLKVCFLNPIDVVEVDFAVDSSSSAALFPGMGLYDRFAFILLSLDKFSWVSAAGIEPLTEGTAPVASGPLADGGCRRSPACRLRGPIPIPIPIPIALAYRKPSHTQTCHIGILTWTFAYRC